MYSVELMVAEHDNILKFIDVVRKACCGILDGREVNADDFEKMIAFARGYADKHHHGKEEQILFAEMTQHLGPVAENLVRHGMLVEHDLGRLHIADLEAALGRYREDPQTIHKLGILAGAAGYANLLERHIARENEAVYPYAERQLPEDIRQSVEERTRAFEADAEARGVQAHSLGILRELTEKYC